MYFNKYINGYNTSIIPAAAVDELKGILKGFGNKGKESDSEDELEIFTQYM